MQFWSPLVRCFLHKSLKSNVCTALTLQNTTENNRIIWGRDSWVGVAIRYWLDRPGIKSRWGARFSALPQTSLGAHPVSFLYIGYRVFPGGKAAGAWRWPPTPYSAEVKEIVELWLYSPSGTSWPLQGWTLISDMHKTRLHFSSMYRVIHKSLRDFRTLRYSSRDGHAEGEHVNRGRDTPSFCPTLQLLDMSTLLCLSWFLRSRVRKFRRDLRITLYYLLEYTGY